MNFNNWLNNSNTSILAGASLAAFTGDLIAVIGGIVSIIGAIGALYDLWFRVRDRTQMNKLDRQLKEIEIAEKTKTNG